MAEAYIQGEISQEEQINLRVLFNELMQTEDLARFYSRDYKVLNEKAILIPKQGVLRPDRVGLGEQGAYVIDYKTGKEKSEHIHQVKLYAEWIEKIIQKKVKMFFGLFGSEAEKPIKIHQLS